MLTEEQVQARKENAERGAQLLREGRCPWCEEATSAIFGRCDKCSGSLNIDTATLRFSSLIIRSCPLCGVNFPFMGTRRELALDIIQCRVCRQEWSMQRINNLSQEFPFLVPVQQKQGFPELLRAFGRLIFSRLRR